MGIILDSLRYSVIKDFADSFTTRNYYLFASSLTDIDVSGNNENSTKLFFEKTIFGKKIDPSEVILMVRKLIWTPGTVYVPYDDTVDLSQSNFYAISEPDSESGDFVIFKCLSNNNGAASTDKPIYSESLASQNYILRTADGYVWKYLCSVTNSQALTYSTRTLFPVVSNPNVVASAKLGIDSIVIVNPTTNFGYETQTGFISSVRTTNTAEGYRIIFLSGNNFNPIRGYYNGYTFYTTSSDGVSSRKYIIRDSGINTSTQRPYVAVEGYVADDITVGLNPDTQLAVVWNYSITPSVEIVGDGTGASAIATVVGSRITAITVLNGGQGYTRAIARITPPSIGFDPGAAASGDVVCSLRAILGPAGVYNSTAGHGGNPAFELRARHVAIVSQLDREDDQIIPTTNTYSKAGIVRDPSFNVTAPSVFDNRLKVLLSSVDQLKVGDVVTQSSSNFRGVIHSIDDINNIIYVTEFYGPYTQTTAQFYLSNIVPLDDSQPLTTPAGRIEILTNGVIYPSYQMGTGELLYVSEFEPIERSENLAEQFKFIISF
jgi:hypothetical protein